MRKSIGRCAVVAVCATALATSAELQFASEHKAGDGWYTLTLEQKSLTFGGVYGITSRGYTNGVTLRVHPGETLQVTLVNNLLESNNVACPLTDGEFCESTTTNFHTHGLHVSSKGVSDGLAYDSDNVFAEIAPGGNQKKFEFAIPDYHMGGTHWYHPHHHHATALQAGGGAAGALIVEDPEGYLPSEYANMIEKVLFVSGINLQTLQTIATSSKSSLLTNAVNTATAANLDTNVFLVNGQLGPTMTISSHVWHRLRMVYAAVEQSLNLKALAVQGGPTCTLNLIAKDGIYLPEVPRAINTVHLYPGARADVAMSCVCSSYPCSATLTSTAGQGGGGGRYGGGGDGPPGAGLGAVDVNVLLLEIQETPGGSQATLPVVTLDRPCYLADLRSATVPAGNSGDLKLKDHDRAVAWNNQGRSMTYDNVHQNGGTMTDWPPIASFTVGSVYEIHATGTDAHPLHFHVNPFQIISMGGSTCLSDGYFQVGDWHDTLYLEELGRDGEVTVRMNTDVFTGKMVVHCHILEHEDEGMMGYIRLTGTEGATYADAAALQPGCYSSTHVPTASTGATSTAAPGTGGGESASRSVLCSVSGSFLWSGAGFLASLAATLQAAYWLLW